MDTQQPSSVWKKRHKFLYINVKTAIFEYIFSLRVFLPFKLSLCFQVDRDVIIHITTQILDLFSLQVFHSSRYILLFYSQVPSLSDSVSVRCVNCLELDLHLKTKRRRRAEEGGGWLNRDVQLGPALTDTTAPLIHKNVAQSAQKLWATLKSIQTNKKIPIILSCHNLKTLAHSDAKVRLCKISFRCPGKRKKEKNIAISWFAFEGLNGLVCAPCYHILTIALTLQNSTALHMQQLPALL